MGASQEKVDTKNEPFAKRKSGKFGVFLWYGLRNIFTAFDILKLYIY